MKLNSVRISLFISIFSFNFSFSQTAVNMSSQPGYTYSENFSDIANWTFNTSPANGTFLSGTGSSAWKGNATNSSGNIPDGIKITTASTSFTTSTTGGVQKGSGNLVLLTTGATDNSSSVAIDLYLNYTSLSAGTLSFDWSSINNSTGDRNSSLKVFTSSDGINFTELVGARVTNFTNNNVTFGSITNVNLPSDFNQKTFAIIRFYIHNGIGTGQIGGSRPKISIDNVVVTGNALSACTTPSLQPTNLSFTTIGSSSVQGNFTASASNPDGYLMLMSSNSSLGALPTNGTAYNIGDNIGDANIVGNGSNTNFTLSSLSSNATYYLYVFALNSNCTGGPVYQTTNPLSGNVTTATGIFPCIAPSSQATSLTFSNITTNSIQGNFSISSGADEWLVVRRTSASLTSNPINTTVYNIGDALGGGVVVGRTTTGAFVANSLNLGTTYYFFIFSLNSVNCSDGPVYYITNPLGGNATTSASYSTSCVTPVSQPGNFISNGDNSSITASFSNVVDADSYLVLYSTSSSLSEQPQNNNNYIVGNSLGNATVLSISNSNSIYLSGLTASTSYYFFVYAKNTFCNGGTKYNLAAPLIASKATTATSTYNPYFGNLHAHSKYSDGNKDNPTFTPANNYAYAKNSQKMDFLGISEHNHSDAYMNILNWSKGLYQADTSTNSSFVALYGQEWGVISNGGHALVYGIDSLISFRNKYIKIICLPAD